MVACNQRDPERALSSCSLCYVAPRWVSVVHYPGQTATVSHLMRNWHLIQPASSKPTFLLFLLPLPTTHMEQTCCWVKEGRGLCVLFQSIENPRYGLVPSSASNVWDVLLLGRASSLESLDFTEVAGPWSERKDSPRTKHSHCIPKSAYVVEKSTMGCPVLRVLSGCLLCLIFWGTLFHLQVQSAGLCS